MQVKPEAVELVRRDYTANGGWETFLSYEDPQQDILVGLLRLRKCAGPQTSRQPGLKGRTSIVRELHVYGTAVAVHARDSSKHQHQVRWPDTRHAFSIMCIPAAHQDAATASAWAYIIRSEQSGAGHRQLPVPVLLRITRMTSACGHLLLPDCHAHARAILRSEIKLIGSLSSCAKHFAMQGYGRLLMEAAEKVAAAEHRSTKLAVISGVGTRHYYRKLGYHLEGPYMVKQLACPPTRLKLADPWA